MKINNISYRTYKKLHGYCPNCMTKLKLYKGFHKLDDILSINEFNRIYDYALICKCNWIGRYPWSISKEQTIVEKIKKINKI